MRITGLRFGCLEVDGVAYHRDLIIMPSGILCPWIRDQGHRLGTQDLETVLDKPPGLLIIGTGMAGRMRVDRDLIRHLGGTKHHLPCHAHPRSRRRVQHRRQ